MSKGLEIIDVNERRTPRQSETGMEERRYRRKRQRARQLAIKRRRRKRLIRLVAAAVVLGAVVLVVRNVDFAAVGAFFSEGRKTDLAGAGMDIQGADAREPFLYEVEYEDFFAENKPQVLSDAGVYERLRELAEEYPELEEIYEKCDEYPVELLASLCNNVEMHEYVKGYLDYAAGDSSVAGVPELTAEEREQTYPLFLQWDRRWGYEAYGDHNIAMSGCGPTTLAMVATAVTNEEVTPDKVAEYSMGNGFYVEGTGTAWSLMTEGAKHFGLKAGEIALDESVMKNQLDAGKVIICSMSPGDFTSVGHFIMIYGYDENGFLVNDSNSIYRSSRSWSYQELKSQIRILWSYERK